MRPVPAPQDLVASLNGFPFTKRLVDLAVMQRDRNAICSRVVDKVMHVLSDQIIGGVIAEEASTRRIAESAQSLEVETTDPFSRGIQQQTNDLFTLAECFLSHFLFGHVLMFFSDAVLFPISRPIIGIRSQVSRTGF
jgi:hypothetical protein